MSKSSLSSLSLYFHFFPSKEESEKIVCGTVCVQRAYQAFRLQERTSFSSEFVATIYCMHTCKRLWQFVETLMSAKKYLYQVHTVCPFDFQIQTENRKVIVKMNNRIGDSKE